MHKVELSLPRTLENLSENLKVVKCTDTYRIVDDYKNPSNFTKSFMSALEKLKNEK